ncbi:uncharacterized protein LOC125944255 [Dermacentor silvarum]|uniref:uncharacterized protein LOC125944255 n=1 Tax=Dermacentor silvarum TaxID=543639 RepID=UPI0021010342|nr:uncharacterized protein LOC125944255 [Dermacentor silvarum]
MARFWFRRLRRADDGGPIYTLELNSPSPPVEEPASLDAVHFGRKGSIEDRSALILAVVVALLAVITIGFALAVIFTEHTSVASLEPLTDFAAYRRQPLSRAELANLRTEYKSSPGTNGVTAARGANNASGSSRGHPPPQSPSTRQQ